MVSKGREARYRPSLQMTAVLSATVHASFFSFALSNKYCEHVRGE